MHTTDVALVRPTALAGRSLAAAIAALHPTARCAVGIQAGIVALSAPLFPLLGLSIDWLTALPNALVLATVLGVCAFYALSGKPRKLIVVETLSALFLIVLFTNVGGAAQYAGVALGLPLADPWLAAADQALGVHVPGLVEWTAARPWFAALLVLSYYTLLPQFVLPLIVLGLVHHDRDGVWEYVFHFHVCLAVTIIGVALFPAACAFSYYGFSSLIDQTRFLSHFEGLRAGTFTEIGFDNIEGLISFPSFHVAGGLMVTWAFRRHTRWLVPVAGLNVLLISATVLTGAHYAIDLLVTVLLFAASVFLWRLTR